MPQDYAQFLSDSWLDYWEHPESIDKRSDLPLWLQDKFSPACGCDPEELWQFILDTYKREMSDRVFAVLAAGPVEDLLAYHGPEFIDRVEAEARQNPRFRELLGGVWRSTITDDIWARVAKARGPVW